MSTMPACPGLMWFVNRGDTEGTNSSKTLCSMFVFVRVVCFIYTCVRTDFVGLGEFAI